MSVISLHTFLDRGGDLRALPFLDILAESIVIDRRLRSEPWLREAAASFRRLAGSMLDDPERHDLATLLLWEAEAYENDDVALRFEQALPPEKLDGLLGGSQEARHPHRLMVTGVERFTCGACGDEYDQTLAVVVDGTEGITYCSACIGLASLAVGQQGRDLDPRDALEPRAALDRGVLDPGDALDPADLPRTTPGAPVLEPVLVGAGAGDAGGPSTGRWMRLRAPAALAMLALAITGSSGLASAGVLPPSLQTVAHETLAFVGIDVPAGPSGASSGGGGGSARPEKAGRQSDTSSGVPRSTRPKSTTRADQPGSATATEPADGAGEPGGRTPPVQAGGNAETASTSGPGPDMRPAVPTSSTAVTARPTTGSTVPGATTTTTTASTTTTTTDPADTTTTTSSTTTTTERGGRRDGVPPPPPPPPPSGDNLPDAAAGTPTGLTP